MTSYTITIPNWHIPSVNKLMSSHWSKAGRIKSGATQMISAYSKHVPKAEGRRLVEITHYQPVGRMVDPDNLFKVAFDSLKNLRLILDDGTNQLDFIKPVMKYGKKQTIITITEVV